MFSIILDLYFIKFSISKYTKILILFFVQIPLSYLNQLSFILKFNHKSIFHPFVQHLILVSKKKEQAIKMRKKNTKNGVARRLVMVRPAQCTPPAKSNKRNRILMFTAGAALNRWVQCGRDKANSQQLRNKRQEVRKNRGVFPMGEN